ncbi:MAG: hypothetical protein HY360_09570 [Verrucomicrobia bacterium]|nr:hypothetical protein [Verrucomicrobiota bacterium]
MEPHPPTGAALSRPILALLLVGFIFNAGSGVGLWLWPTHGWRVFHGWTIPPFLITLGVIWRIHVVRGWNLKKNAVSGALVLALFLALTATGWLIYYAGSDGLQEMAGSWHAGLGLSAGFLLLAHSLLGLKSRDPDEW